MASESPKQLKRRRKIERIIEEELTIDEISTDEDSGSESTDLEALDKKELNLLVYNRMEKKKPIHLKESKESNFISCIRKSCMMKSCRYSATMGLDLTSVPYSVKAFIPYIAPFISDTKCCCFCIGHFIFFVTFVSANIFSDACEAKFGLKDIQKVQKLVNKIDEKGFDSAFQGQVIDASTKLLGNPSIPTLKRITSIPGSLLSMLNSWVRGTDFNSISSDFEKIGSDIKKRAKCGK